MSGWLFMNIQVSVPPTFDTTPCVEHMLDYEDCVADANIDKREFFLPSWPTLYPLYLLYKRNTNYPHGNADNDLKPGNERTHLDIVGDWIPTRYLYMKNKPITDKQFQMVYECEEERLVFKSCLRDLISLKRNKKHTSWDTADISNLYLS